VGYTSTERLSDTVINSLGITLIYLAFLGIGIIYAVIILIGDLISPTLSASGMTRSMRSCTATWWGSL
jgi:hypothetical protein